MRVLTFKERYATYFECKTHQNYRVKAEIVTSEMYL